MNTKKIEAIISKLRDPKNGCQWDIKQTHTTLLPYLIEETYELIEAIKSNENIKEELGDLLLQILLHSKIEEENGHFNFKDVVDDLAKKIVRRHPHVFKNKKKLTDKQLKKQWEEIKIKEGKTNNSNNPFSNINKSQTPILKALEISSISKTLKFDWKDYKGPLKKVKEELKEVIHEKESNDSNLEKIEEEVGDLLFSIVNLSRHLKINPDIALESANNKFMNRFKLMIEVFDNKEKFINSSSKIKEEAWNKIKKL